MIQDTFVRNISFRKRSANICAISFQSLSLIIVLPSWKKRQKFFSSIHQEGSLWQCSVSALLIVFLCGYVKTNGSISIRRSKEWHKKVNVPWDGFSGFKLHLIICNERRELLNFMITSGYVDNHKPFEYKAFLEFIYGKVVGDNGYISKNLFVRLFVDGIQLLTNLKNNM